MADKNSQSQTSRPGMNPFDDRFEQQSDMSSSPGSTSPVPLNREWDPSHSPSSRSIKSFSSTDSGDSVASYHTGNENVGIISPSNVQKQVQNFSRPAVKFAPTVDTPRTASNGTKHQQGPGLGSAYTPPSTQGLPQGLPADATPLPFYDNKATPTELTEEEVREGKARLKRQKFMVMFGVASINFLFIFASWYWPKYYFIYLPFITLPLALNATMIFMIGIFAVKNMVFKPKRIIPEKPESLVMLMPCYNESTEECTKSLNSLVAQRHIDQHPKVIMVVCDGKVRSAEMTKTTAATLTEDILVGPDVETAYFTGAYVAWDGSMMDVECTRGTYKGVPFYCIIKQTNQGKRDSLIVSRSFLFNFNRRHERPNAVFSPEFFAHMADWLQNDADIDYVDALIGMDADTVFADDCISYLVEESHYPGTVGVCGYVAVDFSHGNWNFWSIYQSTEYTIAQVLRRKHQSDVTHKVSCLPGCCQLLKIVEATCGDKVLVDLFGYHPEPTDDILARIRATASEDRNHVCLMLMKSPKAETRQAFKAKAYTDVPHDMRVFLSQRRRWTLGATSNDLMLLTSAPLIEFSWWERLVAFSNVATWTLNIFVIASLACMINAFMHQPFWIIMVFASVMFIPIIYYFGVALVVPKNRIERLQYLIGLCAFISCGPFINIMVTVYALVNMDNFGWGKTRKIVEDPVTGDAAVTAVTVAGEAETGEAEEPDKIIVVHERPPPPQVQNSDSMFNEKIFDSPSEAAGKGTGPSLFNTENPFGAQYPQIEKVEQIDLEAQTRRKSSWLRRKSKSPDPSQMRRKSSIWVIDKETPEEARARRNTLRTPFVIGPTARRPSTIPHIRAASIAFSSAPDGNNFPPMPFTSPLATVDSCEEDSDRS